MRMEQKTARISVLIYTSLSLALVTVFLLVTLLNGEEYTLVARIGGMVWVFVLSMIITMPVVIPKVKDKYQR